MVDGARGRRPRTWAELALETYEKFGIETGILSISSPGVHCGDDAAARRLARKVNDAGAEVVTKHPARFGLFAALPMPDVAGSLEELAYAMDTLHADGIGLKTNTHGIYLGDAQFEPIFQRTQPPQGGGIYSSDFTIVLAAMRDGLGEQR